MLWQILVGVACVYFLVLNTTTTSIYKRLPNSHGHTSTIYLLPAGAKSTAPLVCKSVHPHFATTLFPTEKEVYERFGAGKDIPPSGLLAYYGIHTEIPHGLIMEFAEGGNVQDWLENAGPPTEALLFKWTLQAAEALAFAHSLGIYHSDIHPLNFFLTGDLNLKVGDWGGASVDGRVSHCSYRYKYRLFDADSTDIVKESGVSAATEIFAFGMAVFAMVSGQEVWPELEEPRDYEEIKERIATRRFPDTKQLRILGDVVEGCWNGRFESMEEVRFAIEKERNGFLSRHKALVQQIPFVAK